MEIRAGDVGARRDIAWHSATPATSLTHIARRKPWTASWFTGRNT